MIKLNSISKSYRATQAESSVTVLKNISIKIESGSFAAIIGASGSGKSTLMNILGCLMFPDKGQYFLDGELVFDNKPVAGNKKLSFIRGSKIGFVFQGFNLIPHLTAYENVMLPLKYRGVSYGIRQESAENALSMVGLSNRKHHHPYELSGGQQQRAAIARAIVGNPSVILADEPCGNLDPKNGTEIMRILHELSRNGHTVVLITHDENAAKTADKLIVI